VKEMAGEDGTLYLLRGGREHLRDLDEELPEWWKHFRMVKLADRKKVPVRKILGNVGNGRNYDPDWTPFVEEQRDLEVLKSMKDNGFDPEESRGSPITLLRYRGDYFVESDGHRRVSVARRLGLATIEAEVYQLWPDA
jgi:hypothetical protein